MTGIIFDLCSHNKTDDIENCLEANVEEFASHGLCALAVAYEELDGDDHKSEGNRFELIGLLTIFSPSHKHTKQTIEDSLAFGVTGDQLAIAKETSCHLGLGGHIYPAKVLKDGLPQAANLPSLR